MKPSCYRHPGVAAESSCPRCTESICTVCETMVGVQYHCPPCAKTLKTRATALKGVVALIVAGGLGAGGYAISQMEPPLDYGEQTALVKKLKRQLDKEPCDRTKIVKLGDAMNQAGDYRGAIKRSNAFFQACGDYERLLWIPYHAHKRLSEWQQAADVAGKLIESDPYDKDYRWWRGLAYEKAGALDKAVEDYRQAIALVPQLSSIPINLANVLEKLGRPCEAIFPLEQLRFYRDNAANDERLTRRLSSLYDHPDCKSMSGEGKAEIKFRKGGKIIVAWAKLNGGKLGKFIVDTGASYVALTPQYAEAVGLQASRPIFLQTANGVATGKMGVADRIELGGVTVQRVDTAVLPTLADDHAGFDGLLGLSFLSRFRMTMDQSKGVLLLEAS